MTVVTDTETVEEEEITVENGTEMIVEIVIVVLDPVDRLQEDVMTEAQVFKFFFKKNY